MGTEAVKKFDPLRRGEMAGRVKAETPAWVWAQVRELTRQSWQTFRTSPRPLVAKCVQVVCDPSLRDWTAESARNSGGGLTEGDVRAGLYSIYVEFLLQLSEMADDLADELSAYIATLVHSAVAATRMTALKPPGLEVRGQGDDERRRSGNAFFDLRNEVYRPLADITLMTFATLEMRVPRRNDKTEVRPFGFDPVEDSLWATLDFLLLGQVPGTRFRSNAFLSSAFVNHVVDAGMAKVVPFGTWYCGTCHSHFLTEPREQACVRCGSRLGRHVGRRCLSVNFLARCTRLYESGMFYYVTPSTTVRAGDASLALPF